MQKVLYDENKNKSIYQVGDYLSRGSFGKVYMLTPDKCLKIFNDITDEDIYNEDTFRLLKELKLKNYYEIYKLLYNKNGLFSGYEMKYYSRDISDILLAPSEYTIESFNNILSSVSILSNNGIHASDLTSNNVILNNNGIIVIDADFYSRTYYLTGNKLRGKNIFAVYCLFKELYKEALINNHNFTAADSYLLDDLFILNYNPAKKLTKYKYPIDYFYHQRNKI